MKIVVSNDQRRIHEFLSRTAGDFIPALDSRVDLVSYSQKLSRAAVNFFFRMSELDAAHAAVYTNRIDSGVAFLSSIAVDRQFRDSGVARELLKNVIAECRERRFRTLELEVGKNNSGAIRFYEGFGFRAQKLDGEMFRMTLLL